MKTRLLRLQPSKIKVNSINIHHLILENSKHTHLGTLTHMIKHLTHGQNTILTI